MDLDFHIKNARRIATLLDSKFKILGFSFGLDPLLDIIPGLGNIIGAFTSFYIIWIALQLKLPGKLYLLMLGNILIDWILGSVPVAGIVMDAFYKSNIRNLKLIENNLNTPKASRN